MTTPVPGQREKVLRVWRRIWLFVRIVGRIDQSETRMMPAVAWDVAGTIHPQKESWEVIPKTVTNGLLLGLFKVFHPLENRPTKITIEIDGKPWCTYMRPAAQNQAGDGKR